MHTSVELFTEFTLKEIPSRGVEKKKYKKEAKGNSAREREGGSEKIQIPIAFSGGNITSTSAATRTLDNLACLLARSLAYLLTYLLLARQPEATLKDEAKVSFRPMHTKNDNSSLLRRIISSYSYSNTLFTWISDKLRRIVGSYSFGKITIGIIFKPDFSERRTANYNNLQHSCFLFVSHLS